MHASTIIKRLHKFDLHGRHARKKPLLFKKKTTVCQWAYKQRFTGWICSGQTSCLATVTADMFGTDQRQLFRRRTSYQLRSMVMEMLWFGVALLPQGLDSLHSLIQQWIQHHSNECLKITWGHLSNSWNWIESGPITQDNNPKHTIKSTKEWLKKKKWRVMEWPSQSPDLNPIEMLWGDLKWAVHKKTLQLKEHCMEVWSKRPASRCQRLVANYAKHLQEVISAKGGNTSYRSQGCTYFSHRRNSHLLIFLLNKWLKKWLCSSISTLVIGTDSKRIECLLVQICQNSRQFPWDVLIFSHDCNYNKLCFNFFVSRLKVHLHFQNIMWKLH